MGRRRAMRPCFPTLAPIPSLDHQYLWSALKEVGVPPLVLRATRALYARNWPWLKRQPWLESHLCVTSGVCKGARSRRSSS